MARLDEDREILRKFAQSLSPRDGFDESKYAYTAEYIGAKGVYLWQAKALGWEVIRGDMPENKEMRDENGNCTMGDVVYMRMPRDRYEQLQLARQALVREERGEKSQDELRKDINEKISRIVGSGVEVSFKFDKRSELNEKRGR